MKILYYLKRAVSLPPYVVIQKILHRIQKNFLAKKKRFRDERFSTYESSCSHSYLNRFVDGVDLSRLPREEIHKLNAHFIQHEFDLLGSGYVRVFHGMQCKGIDGICYPPAKLGLINAKNREESERIRRLIYQPYETIDWQLDFKSGYRWKEDTWSEDVQYGKEIGVDVKVPWELARMQHLCNLAWGYGLEADESYLLEFRNQVLDFIAFNPPRYGVNWVCTMDVGIRIANWLLAYDIFMSFGAKFDEEFEAVFVRSVYEHAKHIFHHLEWDPHLRSNHYLANIVGLLFASSYLPKDPEIQTWLNFSISELKKEVMSQFNPEGTNFEASTSYHRLSTEMVVFGTALAIEMGTEFPKEFLDRLGKMADFIRDITKPDGTIVQFGDNDSGRFMKVFPERVELDHRYLIKPIRNLSSLTSLIEDLLTPSEEPSYPISKYTDFGLYIFKNEPWYLAFRVGSIGQNGNGGHAHNDQLSFELAVQGISMIVDPGTYIYTPLSEKRRLFRSSMMHNTLVIDGKEQNQDEGLFRMTDVAKAKVIDLSEKGICAQHQGYGSIHKRSIFIHEEGLEGTDEFERGAKKIYFHLAPGWEIQSIDIGKTTCRYENMLVEISSADGIWETNESEYSKAYGVKEKAFVLVLLAHEEKVRWRFLLLSSRDT